MNPSESEIIPGLKNGDERVLQYLVHQMGPSVLSFLEKKGCSRERAKDFFNNALEVIILKARAGKLELINCTFRTYIISICLNQWRNFARRKKFDAGVTPDELRTLTDNYDFSTELEEAELRQIIRDLVEQLAEECRKLIRWFYFGEFGLKEIARRMGYTDGYVRKKSSTCKKKLIKLTRNDPRFQDLFGRNE